MPPAVHSSRGVYDTSYSRGDDNFDDIENFDDENDEKSLLQPDIYNR
jgi:hypothetical protein